MMARGKERNGLLRGMLLICLLAVLLRAPYATVPFFNVDEALIAVMADTVLEGGVLYRDAWEHQASVQETTSPVAFASASRRAAESAAWERA